MGIAEGIENCIGPDNRTLKVHNCKIIADMPVLQQTNRDGETTTISTSVLASNLLMPGWLFENSGKLGIMCKFLTPGENLELFLNILGILYSHKVKVKYIFINIGHMYK